MTSVVGGRNATHLDQVRHRGYALDLEENEPGVRCVAAPLFLGGTAPVAAVSVTAIRDRMPPARMEALGHGLRAAIAERLTARFAG
ncbi:IclR family transcriptional regulator C-terminal domain-containing protein [Nonomuraea sp. NPDC050790]|uniref:IclR family transcriptional regulator domain-containing protein n=1 Tax=Nonomuraea sp. NPDC050790 TaxID=3364371 RepID=UPI0037AF8B7E